MHILFLFVVGPLLLLLAGAAVLSLMTLAVLMLEFPVLLVPVVGLAWLLRSAARPVQQKNLPCAQM